MPKFCKYDTPCPEASTVAAPLAGLDSVYGWKREVAGNSLYVCLDRGEEIAAPGRAQAVLAKAEKVLKRTDPRSTLFIVNDQFMLERFLPCYPQLFGIASGALREAASGKSMPPQVLEADWTYYITAELHIEQNVVIFRRPLDNELMEMEEPDPGYIPIESLNDSVPAPLPKGGLHPGPDGYMYDQLSIFPRFPVDDGKLVVAFRVDDN